MKTEPLSEFGRDDFWALLLEEAVGARELALTLRRSRDFCININVE